MIPDFLSHYYEASQGPFRNLSDLRSDEAEVILNNIRQKGDVFASKQVEDYLDIRHGLEGKIRELFIEKGGKPHGQELRIFLIHFRPEIVSMNCQSW